MDAAASPPAMTDAAHDGGAAGRGVEAGPGPTAGTGAVVTGGGDGGTPAPIADAATVKPARPPFVPGECTVRSLDPATQCANPDDGCPVELAGEVDCVGAGMNPSLAFDGHFLYASLRVSEERLGPFSLLGLRIDPEDITLAVHAAENSTHGMVRLDRTTPVLLASDGTQLTALRSDDNFEQFTADEPLPLAGIAWEAYYTSRGDLHIWSDASPGMGTQRDGTAVLPGAVAHAAALDSDDREATVSVMTEQNGNHVRLWDSDGQDREVGLVPHTGLVSHRAQVAVTPYAVASGGWLVSWDVDARVFSAGAGFDGVPLLGTQDASLRTCSKRMMVNAPAICPSDTSSEATGEQLVSHGVVADQTAGPWLIALVADGTASCSWQNVGGGCFESLPCDCMQVGRTDFHAPTIVLQSISEQVQTWRIPFPEAALGELAYTSLADGRLFVALTFMDAADARLHTHLRYFAVRLAPAAEP